MGAMEEWSKIYGEHFGPIYIEDWDWIQLRLSGYSDWWVSCWGSGSACYTRQCPGTTGSIHRDNTNCRGEWFQIVDQDGTYILHKYLQ